MFVIISIFMETQTRKKITQLINVLKKPNEFIVGIIIGCLLTLLGSYIAHYLNTLNQEKLKKDGYVYEVLETMSNRITYVDIVMHSSSSSVFPNRWDNYMDKGYHPWEAKKSRLMIATSDIFGKKPNIITKIDSLFYITHHNLLIIRGLQLTDDAKKNMQLNNCYKKTKMIIDETKDLIKEVENITFGIAE